MTEITVGDVYKNGTIITSDEAEGLGPGYVEMRELFIAYVQLCGKAVGRVKRNVLRQAEARQQEQA